MKRLCRAFAADEDIHALVASQVYGVPQAEVTPEMRRSAKAVNFGIIYGQSAFGLAKALGIEQEQAAAFIDAYFLRYPGVEKFLAKILEDCQAKGYVGTVLGRRRAIQGIRPIAARSTIEVDGNSEIEDGLQPAAESSRTHGDQHGHSRLCGRPDQTGHDFDRSSACEHESSPARMLLQIHDELVFEVPADDVDPSGQASRGRNERGHAVERALEGRRQDRANWAETEPWN